jgi:hypothetical protein
MKASIEDIHPFAISRVHLPRMIMYAAPPNGGNGAKASGLLQIILAQQNWPLPLNPVHALNCSFSGGETTGFNLDVV